MPKLSRLMALVTLGLASLGTPLYGWWEAGHMTVALIAKGQLTPAAAKNIQEILAFAFDGDQGEDPFLFASVWPDLIKDKGVRCMDSWHYVNWILASNQVVSASETAYQEGGESTQVVAIIDQCLKTLRNPQSGQWEKAFMLRWLIHLVGDLHQPLHCATLYSAQFKTGDLGGIKFELPLKETPNLHFLWDAGLGAIPNLRYLEYSLQPKHAPSEALRRPTEELKGRVPREKLPQLLNPSLKAWGVESFDLAKSVAYAGITPGQAPSAAYLAKSRLVVAQQLTLAGYRLADLLNELYRDKK
jgi:hypothetical protein